MPTDSLVIKRHFRAPPERVFAAFTEKSLMQAWYGPENMTVPQCEVDPRVGGKYRVEMHGPAGSVHVVTGEFREIRPPERLVYTWGWLNGTGRGPETIVTLTFASRDGGTDLTLEQTGFLDGESRDRHEEGWRSSLDGLGAASRGGRSRQRRRRPCSATIVPPMCGRPAWPSPKRASPARSNPTRRNRRKSSP